MNVDAPALEERIDELSTSGSKREPSPKISEISETKGCKSTKFFRARKKYACKQVKNSPMLYILAFIFIVISLTVATLVRKSDYSDIFWSTSIASVSCYFSTLLFIKNECRNDSGVPYEETCFRCCRDRETTMPLTRERQYKPSKEKTNFVHEVADVSDSNPAESSPTSSRKEESLDAPVDVPPLPPPVAIAVDVHREVQSSSCSSEGACGYTDPETGVDGPPRDR